MRCAELVLCSTLAEYERLERFLVAFTEELHVSQAFSDNLLFCVKELFINAVTHGNRYQEGYKVYCRLELHADALVVTVLDEGQGFALEALPDPRQAPFCEQLCGRGLFCMQSLVDGIAVVVNERGCAVTLRWKFIH
uniref:Putative anti-sigma regulatory factor (Serine/threonine protein kinase) n=1 Tax=Chlorobium chlorochromatii (strain CaD3) TaxID=340177 RepID=Q3ASZ1_CHLCH